MIQGNVALINGTPYINSYPIAPAFSQLSNFDMNRQYSTQKGIDNAISRGWLTPLTGFQQQSQQRQPSINPAMQTNFQSYLNGLGNDASNALNGGLLGYQQSQITSAGSNPQTVSAPQGNFRFPFGLLRGY